MNLVELVFLLQDGVVLCQFVFFPMCSGGSQAVDERAVIMGFQQWLAGVTERIHQTMHYQLDGEAHVGLGKNLFIE